MSTVTLYYYLLLLLLLLFITIYTVAKLNEGVSASDLDVLKTMESRWTECPHFVGVCVPTVGPHTTKFGQSYIFCVMKRPLVSGKPAEHSLTLKRMSLRPVQWPRRIRNRRKQSSGLDWIKENEFTVLCLLSCKWIMQQQTMAKGNGEARQLPMMLCKPIDERVNPETPPLQDRGQPEGWRGLSVTVAVGTGTSRARLSVRIRSSTHTHTYSHTHAHHARESIEGWLESACQSISGQV